MLENRTYRKHLWALALAALMAASPGVVEAAGDRTAKVKAVFLFKFLDYMTWPSGHQPKDDSPPTVCTLGANPFGGLLREIGSRPEIGARVQGGASASDLGGCHIVYVAGAGQLGAFSGRPVLTVSEQRGFAQGGGMIELRQAQDKIRLIVNLTAMQQAGIKASSRLLGIAEIVR